MTLVISVTSDIALRKLRFWARFYKVKVRLTKRAPDVWESARFTSIFLASSFSCSQAESTPAHTRVTQTVGRLISLNVQKELLKRIIAWIIISESQDNLWKQKR